MRQAARSSLRVTRARPGVSPVGSSLTRRPRHCRASAQNRVKTRTGSRSVLRALAGSSGSISPSAMPHSRISLSGMPTWRRTMRWNGVNAACGQVCSPNARAAIMTLWMNMPQSSQLPFSMSRSSVKNRPTGAPKNS